MNDSKLTKWNRFIRSNLLHTACITAMTAFIIRAIDNYGGINLMESLYQSFVVELWPIWIGLACGLLYWVSREIISIHKFIAKGLKFDQELDKLGSERRNIMTHVNDCYNGLSGRIDKIEKRLPLHKA